MNHAFGLASARRYFYNESYGQSHANQGTPAVCALYHLRYRKGKGIEEGNQEVATT
jgi:hypothetical protein